MIQQAFTNLIFSPSNLVSIRYPSPAKFEGNVDKLRENYCPPEYRRLDIRRRTSLQSNQYILT